MRETTGTGHLAALFTVAVWGTTYISTKVLLNDFTPVEILIFRFVPAIAALFFACPRPLRGTTLRQELCFAAAGFFGVCLYYLLENIALTYTFAASAGIIIATAPFFTALFAFFLPNSGEKPGKLFFVGFAVAMAGIALINLNGSRFQLNPLGDVLALLAAVAWAAYSLLAKKIAGFGYPTILTTRRVFLYGLALILPTLFFSDFHWEPARFLRPENAFNLLFLGLGASALCFVTWNFAVRILGAVKTCVYIYAGPVVTVVTATLILKEPFTATLAVGTALTLLGLILSEGNFRQKKKE